MAKVLQPSILLIIQEDKLSCSKLNFKYTFCFCYLNSILFFSFDLIFSGFKHFKY